MKTAVDSSVLVAIFNEEITADAWLRKLVECRREGQLVISDVVYAELAGGFNSSQVLDAVLDKLGDRI